MTKSEMKKKKKRNKGGTKQKAKCSRAEYYRRRREKIKANPETYELAKKKERDRYAKRVSEGKIKMVT